MNGNERDRQQGGQEQQGQQKQGVASQGQRGSQPGQQQQQGGEGQQYGEGNYKATRDYNAGVKDHMQHHDIEKEARDAAPKSDAEARDMERAEEVGRSRARSKDDDRGDPDDTQSSGVN
jgi:hypothetical protein